VARRARVGLLAGLVATPAYDLARFALVRLTGIASRSPAASRSSQPSHHTLEVAS
jgi:hypothetical protein